MTVALPEYAAGFFRIVEHRGFIEVELLDPKLPEAIGEALIGAASEGEWARLILDCSRVHFLTSMGLGALIRLDRQLRPMGGRLRLCRLNPDLRELFAITRIDRVIQLFEGRDEAMATPW